MNKEDSATGFLKNFLSNVNSFCKGYISSPQDVPLSSKQEHQIDLKSTQSHDATGTNAPKTDDEESLFRTSWGLEEQKRYRTRKQKKTVQNLKRKPYDEAGTKRHLRHDYCPMPGQRLIQDEQLIKQTLLKSCGCTNKCMSKITAAQIALLRTVYCGLGSRYAQQEFIKGLARDFRQVSDKDERLQPHLQLPNSHPMEVCQTAFCLVYGMDQGGLSLPTLKKHIKARFGPELIASRKPRGKPMFDFVCKFFSHLMMLCTRVSTDRYGQPIYHLSFSTEWKKLYSDRFIPWMRKHYPDSKIPSESEFYSVHENPDYPFHNLHMPGDDEFGRCTECGALNETIWAANGPKEREDAIQKRDLHDKMVNLDQAWYHLDNALCAQHPDQKVCMAIDQTTLKTGIPSHRPHKKMFDRCTKLEVNLGGGINFSMSQEHGMKYLFVHFSHFTKDANLVLTQLFFMIWAMLTSGFAASRTKVLRIHLDNAPSENKHQFLWAFNGWLLLMQWFQKVLVTFLPVGHTGNEVDSSVFRFVKDKAKVMDIECLYDVFIAAKEGLTLPNELIYLKSVLDFRSFFQPFLLGVQKTMKGRCFEFKLSDAVRPDGSKFPVMRGKKYLNDLAEFGDWTAFMDGKPKGMPKPLASTRDVLRDEVRATLQLLLKHPKLIKGEERKAWLETFVESNGSDAGVRVVGPHEPGSIGRPGKLQLGGLTLNLRVLEAEALPPLQLTRAASKRCTVVDEQFQEMLDAEDGGRLHMKLIPSAAKRFANIHGSNSDSEADAQTQKEKAALPVSATTREVQLEKVIDGLRDSVRAISAKQNSLERDFQVRLEEQRKQLEANSARDIGANTERYRRLKKAFNKSAVMMHSKDSAVVEASSPVDVPNTSSSNRPEPSTNHTNKTQTPAFSRADVGQDRLSGFQVSRRKTPRLK